MLMLFIRKNKDFLGERKFLMIPKGEFGYQIRIQGFPGGTAVENLPANAGDTGSSPGPGRSHMPRSN